MIVFVVVTLSIFIFIGGTYMAAYLAERLYQPWDALLPILIICILIGAVAAGLATLERHSKPPAVSAEK